MQHGRGKLSQRIAQILERYERYKQQLRYPGDWGERALRGWIVREVFQDALGWSSAATVFGEQFDVLFVNGRLLPVIYLETKKPEVILTNKHRRHTLRRADNYPTLHHVVLTNGWLWERRDGGNFADLVLGATLDFRQAPPDKRIVAFFAPLHAKNFWG